LVIGNTLLCGTVCKSLVISSLRSSPKKVNGVPSSITSCCPYGPIEVPLASWRIQFLLSHILEPHCHRPNGEKLSSKCSPTSWPVCSKPFRIQLCDLQGLQTGNTYHKQKSIWVVQVNIDQILPPHFIFQFQLVSNSRTTAEPDSRTVEKLEGLRGRFGG